MSVVWISYDFMDSSFLRRPEWAGTRAELGLPSPGGSRRRRSSGRIWEVHGSERVCQGASWMSGCILVAVKGQRNTLEYWKSEENPQENQCAVRVRHENRGHWPCFAGAARHVVPCEPSDPSHHLQSPQSRNVGHAGMWGAEMVIEDLFLDVLGLSSCESSDVFNISLNQFALRTIFMLRLFLVIVNHASTKLECFFCLKLWGLIQMTPIRSSWANVAWQILWWAEGSGENAMWATCHWTARPGVAFSCS